MKKKICMFSFWIILFFSILALLKGSIYDTPQRCYDTAAAVLGKNGERAAAALSGDYTLVYKIYYFSLIPMGTFKISKTQRREGPVFTGEALTDDSFADIFVHASMHMESHFNGKSGMPYRYVETTRVRDKIKQKTIVFDHAERIASYGDMKIKIYEDTCDPLGAFVKALHFPFVGTSEYSIDLLSKKTIYLLSAKKSHESKEFFEILVDVRRENRTSSHGATFKVWLTSAGRIPLVFKSWTPAGYVSVVIEKIEI